MSQGSLANPTTGTLSGLTAVSTDNGSADALNTENSGATAPTNQLSGSPSAGNRWLNTTVSAQFQREYFDGAQWLTTGYVDTVNHIWEPVIGGGSGSLAAAATTDLGSIPQSFATITGAAPISSFGASAPIGSLKGITFAVAGAVLVASANLTLQGGLNITVNAGDSALCWQIGAGTWLVFFSRANGLAPVITPVSAFRQTVQQGPGGGSPSFIPATSASLSITSTGVSSGSPLIVSAAQGFGFGGQVDLIGQATANLTWPSLTANLLNYLGVSISALGVLTALSTALAPIYQFGGAISTANGQYTFDRAQMKMFLGNGSVANAVAVVFVGEALAGASTITAAFDYAYNGYFDSGWTATLPAAGASPSVASNIGVTDVEMTFVIECTTADNGYAVGDQFSFKAFSFGSTTGSSFAHPYAFWTNRNAVGAAISADTVNIYSMAAKSGGSGNLTRANWQYKFVVKRNW